jgi:hypothetical protein
MTVAGSRDNHKRGNVRLCSDLDWLLPVNNFCNNPMTAAGLI